MPLPELPKREELFELYKVALEEYRYEVSLGWDRLKHYFIVNAGLTTVGATLLKYNSDSRPSLALDLIVAAVFGVGCCAAVLGIMSIFRSREYYRATVFKKALLEQLLGYDQPISETAPAHLCLAIGTTRGMRRFSDVLKWTEQDLRTWRLQPGSLVFYSAIALALAGLIDVLCVAYLILRHLVPCALSLLGWS